CCSSILLNRLTISHNVAKRTKKSSFLCAAASYKSALGRIQPCDFESFCWPSLHFSSSTFSLLLRRRSQTIVTAALVVCPSSEPRKTALRSFLNRAFIPRFQALPRLDRFIKYWLDKTCRPLSTARNAGTQLCCKPAQPSAVHSRCQRRPVTTSTGLPSAAAPLAACRLRAHASRRATPALARFQGDRRFIVRARSEFCLRSFIPIPMPPPLDLSAWLLAQIITALSAWRSRGRQEQRV